MPKRTIKNYCIDENGDVWRVCRKCGVDTHQSKLKKRPYLPHVKYDPLCKSCYNKYYRGKRAETKEEPPPNGKELMAKKPEYTPTRHAGHNKDLCSLCPNEDECRARVMGERAKRWPMCVIPDRNDIEYMYAIQKTPRQARRKSKTDKRFSPFDGCAYLQVEAC